MLKCFETVRGCFFLSVLFVDLLSDQTSVVLDVLKSAKHSN